MITHMRPCLYLSRRFRFLDRAVPAQWRSIGQPDLPAPLELSMVRSEAP